MGRSAGSVTRRSRRSWARLRPTARRRWRWQFSTAGSTGDGRSYEWNFDDGNGFQPGRRERTHSFTGRRNYDVRVRVTDMYGDQDLANVVISAGNRPPDAPSTTAATPSGGWAVGDPLHFTGSATDPDTGAPAANESLTYEWQLTIRHCTTAGGCHSHDISTAPGQTADFVAPDHSYPSLLWITLTVRDALGLTAEKRIELAPRTVQLSAKARRRRRSRSHSTAGPRRRPRRR